jgi:hypothetical protein
MIRKQKNYKPGSEKKMEGVIKLTEKEADNANIKIILNVNGEEIHVSEGCFMVGAIYNKKTDDINVMIGPNIDTDILSYTTELLFKQIVGILSNEKNNIWDNNFGENIIQFPEKTKVEDTDSR